MKYLLTVFCCVTVVAGCGEETAPITKRARTTSVTGTCNRACASVDACGFPSPFGPSDCPTACRDTYETYRDEFGVACASAWLAYVACADAASCDELLTLDQVCNGALVDIEELCQDNGLDDSNNDDPNEDPNNDEPNDDSSGDDEVPAAWVCPATYFGDSECDCGCGALDVDCNSGASCTSPGCRASACEYCVETDGSVSTCEGGGDGDGQDGSVPSAWACPAEYFGDGDCDCGCGAADVDCGSEPSCSTPGCAASACDYCFDPADSGSGACNGGSQTLTGVGDTVAECQGSASAEGTVNGQTPQLNSGFGGLQQGATNIFLFSRDTIDMVNLPGTAGEWKSRIVLTSTMGGNQYGATMFVGQWSTGSQSWTGQTTETAIVTISGYDVVDGTGLLCNGYIAGTAQALFVGNEPFGVSFAVPMLTPSFPSAY